MEQDVKSILAQAGMKERDIYFLLKLAKRKNISVSKAFLLYAWKGYAWGCILLLTMLFPATMGGIEIFLVYMLCSLALVIVSVFFSPFFINLVWSVRVQIKLMGK
ncbi:hypothetical protein [Pseudocitrobacter vendiensis]|uniref:Competence protein n=1 Tax=Pseudocitrobacter vendiensis TaxID=2488306 RepID=A0ABN8TKI1_9ENTR|nr:hypothetical protein [Pseudocitrobacter vendiensis]CAH6662060.1 hypothetical protein FBBNIHIM_23410 [Pseudocitrobacter vendiensis]